MTPEGRVVLPVIVPFYRRGDQLARCLEHLKVQTVAADLELFVHDNSVENLFFTAAVNRGLMRHAFRPDVEYVVVLNQDAYLARTALQELKHFMDTHPECGIAAPLQLRTGSDEVAWGGSLQAFPTGEHLRGRRDEFTESREVYWANGCCMMLRPQMVKQIGLLDENMRFVCSDSDYSFTARARGWKVFMVASAIVEHALGESEGMGKDAALDRVKLADILYFAEKWLTGGLYRRLAREGQVPDEEVRRIVGQLKAMLAPPPS